MGKGKRKKRHDKDGGKKKRKDRDVRPGDNSTGVVAPAPRPLADPDPAVQHEPAEAEHGDTLRRFYRQVRQWVVARMRYFTRGNRPFTTALVLFALGQVLVGFWQWDAMDKQWRVMVLDQRPWLSFTPPVMSPNIGLPLEADFTVSNSGKTPGKIVGNFCYFLVLEEGDPRITVTEGQYALSIDFDKLLDMFSREAGFSQSGVAVAPSATGEFAMRGQTKLTLPTYEKIEDGEAIVLLFPYMEYTFGEAGRAKTCACFLYVPGAANCARYTKYGYMD